ncbi:hypothetical protein B0H63DRAFT_464754, partial [Podospora didyma]
MRHTEQGSELLTALIILATAGTCSSYYTMRKKVKLFKDRSLARSRRPGWHDTSRIIHDKKRHREQMKTYTPGIRWWSPTQIL